MSKYKKTILRKVQDKNRKKRETVNRQNSLFRAIERAIERKGDPLFEERFHFLESLSNWTRNKLAKALKGKSLEKYHPDLLRVIVKDLKKGA
jgi:flagellar motility protein MotE (MotC chaperone)